MISLVTHEIPQLPLEIFFIESHLNPFFSETLNLESSGESLKKKTSFLVFDYFHELNCI